MHSSASMTKRLRKTLAILDQAKADWLALSIAPSSFSQLCRAYMLTSETINEGSPDSLLHGASVASSWQVLAVTAVSYAGLAMLVLVLSAFALRLLFRGVLAAPQGRQGRAVPDAGQPASATDLFSAIQYTYLVPLSMLATVANFCGLVDITAMPLLADIFLGIWRLCAVFGAVVSITALPLYVLLRPRYHAGDAGIAQQQQQQQHRLAPWFLLYIPGIVAASTASELAAILPNQQASSMLVSGYILWGSSVVPALSFTVVFLKARLGLQRQPNVHHLVLPLSLLSQTALGIMTLGIQSQRVWADSTSGPATAPLLLGEMAVAAGAILGMVFWAAAAAWFVSSHLVVLLRTTSPKNMLRALGMLVTTRIVAFPVASFAIATAVFARIWRSMAALALARLLLIYVGVILSGIYVAMIWSVGSAVFGLFACRDQQLAEMQSQEAYAENDDRRPCLDRQQIETAESSDAGSARQLYGTL